LQLKKIILVESGWFKHPPPSPPSNTYN